MSTEIKKLKDSFEGRGEVKGFTFKKVYEDDLWYIFKVDKSHFEVFLKRVNQHFITKNHHEQYPTANAFGIWAWTFKSIEECHKKIKDYNENSNIMG